MNELNSYTLRPLQATDLFLLAKVVGKLNLKQLSDLDLSGNQQALGFVLIGVVLESLENCEKEIYDLLARLANVKPVEIKALEADVFIEMVLEVIKSESFTRAITQVQRLLAKSE